MLPGDIEIDLYRISNGEPIRWKGMSSGVTETTQGAIILGTGAFLAVLFAPGGLAAILDILRALNGNDPGVAVEVAFSLFGLVGVAAALALFWFGWRTLRTAKRVAWAVTSKRLIRMIGGEADRAQSWLKSDIVKFERMKWGASGAEGLAVTVRGRKRKGRRRNRVLTIIGPTDLGDAERALAALED